MKARRWAPIVLGILLSLFGSGFALQGANVIGGSSLMDGNSTFIYVGAVVIVVGLVLILLGAMSKSRSAPASNPAATTAVASGSAGNSTI